MVIVSLVVTGNEPSHDAMDSLSMGLYWDVLFCLDIIGYTNINNIHYVSYFFVVAEWQSGSAEQMDLNHLKNHICVYHL